MIRLDVKRTRMVSFCCDVERYTSSLKGHIHAILVHFKKSKICPHINKRPPSSVVMDGMDGNGLQLEKD